MERFRTRGLAIIAVAGLSSFLSALTQAGDLSAEVASDLPEDAPIVPEVIYRMKYTRAESGHIEAGPTLLYGDKFLDSKGIDVGYTQYLAEHWAIHGGIAMYKNSVTDEARSVATYNGTAPQMHNPNWSFKASALYEPVYGKFAVGSWIQHFRMGIEAGFHLAHEASYSISSSSSESGDLNDYGLYSDAYPRSATKLGPQVGLRLDFPVNDRFSAILKGEWMTHGALYETESGGRSLWSSLLSIGYRI